MEKIKELILNTLENKNKVLDVNTIVVKELPKEIGKCTSLKVLRIISNNLISLPPEIGNLKKLEILWLSGNHIEAIPPEIGELTNLKELYLNSNKITTLPIELTYLKRLKKLIIHSNKITQLPFEFCNLKLDVLQINKNPMVSPPIEIAVSGMWSIRNYFDSIAATEEIFLLKEAKLLLVGEGNVGKTCIANRLRNESYILNEDEETTEGIDITKWKVKYSQNSEISVNIWDFGGQEIYHSTHQFFLTKRSIYVYVWNARTDDDLSSRFEYWLNTIKLLSDNSPLIIVQNKIDERLKLIDEDELRKLYPNIVGFVNVSVKNNHGFDELIKIIKHDLTRLPHLGDRLPKKWLDIKKALKSKSSNFISYKEYLSICEANGVLIEKAHFLGKYFHDLGVFLHFSDNQILRNTLFLKPQWATNAVYKIMDTKEVVVNKGRFNYEQLKDIWSDYPDDKYFQLLELMKRFELCFQIPQSYDYIVPNLLLPTKPNYSWNDKYNLKFEYHYKFMPSGIISRFIVRVHDLLKEDCYWKNGLVIKREKAEAEIISYPIEKRIRIKIKGRNKSTLLSIIRREIEYIHKTQNDPTVEEMLPCNCKECKASENPFLHSYKKLLKALQKKKSSVECNSSFEQVKVKSLLEGVGLNVNNLNTSTINIFGNYINESNMNVNIENINGGTQNFADIIIQSNNLINETEKPILELIATDAENLEQQETLVKALDNLKDPNQSSKTKRMALEIWKNFLNSGAKEAGKKIITEVIENGANYLEPLMALI